MTTNVVRLAPNGLVQIVMTPGSGDGRARATARRLQKALARRGYEAHTRTFTELDRLRRWAETCAPRFSHLVGVGGDATLSTAAAAAVRLGVPFVPVPTGFGNMFAGAFGHAAQTRRVIELFERGRLQRVDVGTVNGGEDLFLSHRSYGMLEEIQHAVERDRGQPRSRLRRHLAYYAMARHFVFGTPLPSVRVELDGELVAEDAAVVTVANVETYRGFLSLTPAASPLDGLFDVCVIPRASKPVVWLRLVRLLLGLPGCWAGIVRRRARSARVAVSGRAPEALAVRHGVLPVLVPPGSVERLEDRRVEADPWREMPGAPAPDVIERREAALRARA